MRTLVVALAAGVVLGGFLTARGASVSAFLEKSEEWFRGKEAREITRNVLSWQISEGSWPKNVDTTRKPTENSGKGTFDNGATTDELRFLSRAFNATGDPAAKEGFSKGLDLILRAQYPNGGWPQMFPSGEGYHRHITFNDQTMARLMRFVRDVATQADFRFVDEERRAACDKAFVRGIDCIVRAQVRVEGVMTVWCAQHDERTLEPRPARTFELVSLSGAESAGILDLLMSIEKPSPEVIAAVDAGVAWFDAVKIHGVRQEKMDGDKRLVADSNAPPLWARFYEIGTNRPIFAGRDGVKRYAIGEIEAERRNGYAWYGNWGKDLPRKHEEWMERIKRSDDQQAVAK